MTAWQKLGEPETRIYRRLIDAKVMAGVKRIDVIYMECGTLIITVETEQGTMAVNLNSADR